MAETNMNRFDGLYGQFLRKYWHPPVVIHGIKTTMFDYAKMQSDAKRKGALLDKIQNILAKAEPDTIINRKAAKAFWINVYNFAAMSLIVKYYPVHSIRDLKISWIKHPWSKKIIDVGGTFYSLSYIEKMILLKKYHDPRIVFAVSCAAISCPDQMPESYTASKINQQLNNQLRRFLTNPTKGLRVDKKQHILYLSWIFKKDRHLFGKTNQALLNFIQPFLNNNAREWLSKNKHITIAYLPHDWMLNDLSQSKLSNRE